MSIAAVILAAGRSTRMGANKMLADIDGEPLIRRTVAAVLGSQANPVILVSGHEAKALTEALAGLDLLHVHNPRYAQGLSTSLIAGIGAVPQSAAGAVICLGDMALVGAGIIGALMARFEQVPAVGAVVPVHAGEWGNPVLVARKLFPEIVTLSGDAGARKLLQGREDVEVVEIADDAVLIDADTPAALESMRAKLGRP
ncbi:molybdenum cofactor cytidylyltransferase [Rhizobiales bacterium GAS191]|jgi:molybdenum cofactor cytidylyltransferase|nr:molybdenum cofactor cytidylyltransferase [Rhizobiales bacterium GAS191]